MENATIAKRRGLQELAIEVHAQEDFLDAALIDKNSHLNVEFKKLYYSKDTKEIPVLARTVFDLIDVDRGGSLCKEDIKRRFIALT